MKFLFIVLIAVLIIYLVIAVVSLLIAIAMNGRWDQSKQPIKKLAKEVFSWPLVLLRLIVR